MLEDSQNTSEVNSLCTGFSVLFENLQFHSKAEWTYKCKVCCFNLIVKAY